MDASAIVHASDQVLRGLGLETGDILSLRAYVSQNQGSNNDEERQARKASLIEQLLEQKKTSSGGNGTKRKPQLQTGSKKQKHKSSKKVQVGWMHYNEGQQRYVPVRMAKGGGARDIEMPLDADIEYVKESSASLFFPNGTSNFGKLDEIELSVGNYSGDILSLLKDDSGVSHAFSIQKYYKINKTTRARLYLMSRQKSSLLNTPQSGSKDLKAVENESKVPDSIIVVDKDEGSESELESNVPDDMNVIDKYDTSDEELYYRNFLDSDLLDSIEPSIDQLIGSSSERASLIAEQEGTFQQSQAYDRFKMEQEVNEENKKADDAIRANQLRMERSNRVPEQPADKRNAVLVNVRHVNLGLQSRSFPSNGTVSYVYDWVGSLDTYPENFRLFKMREEVLPSDHISKVHKCTLFMEEVEDPILLSPVGEVSMPGYAASNEHCRIEQIQMARTAFAASPQQARTPREVDENNYKTLCKKQRLFRNEMEHHNYEGHLVRRDDVLNQLLQLYKDGLVDRSKIAFLRFEGEEGTGDGVTCDVFSSFWDEFYSKFCEGSGRV